MKISLLISTYNWPEALACVLESVRRQRRMPDEVLIADDGSGEATRETVRRYAALLPCPLRHVWHEDDGFRLAAIRNKAIAAATGDYIVQVDGDCILDRHFVADHGTMAEPGYFVCGSRTLVSEARTAEVTKACRPALHVWSRGIRARENGLRMSWLSRLLRDRQGRIRGCNMAFWRDDLVRVNGYDESFTGWGNEDLELAVRLQNAGVKRRTLKFGGILYHLWHPFAPRDRQRATKEIVDRCRAERRTRCERGVDRYLGPEQKK